MKKELSYFTIDGEYGGNQDWFTNIVMHVGGCAAATACDSCIYFAQHMGMTGLYPFDSDRLTKKDYLAFSQKMKPFLKPRMRGVSELWMYTEGVSQYIETLGDYSSDNGTRLSTDMVEFSGENDVSEAQLFLKNQLDRGLPVPYLMLRHQNAKKFKDFIWHWFLIVGYEERDEGPESEFYIKAATYGEATWFNLKELWETGEEEKGGMIGYEIIRTEGGSTEV